MRKLLIISAALVLFFASCQDHKSLPIYGPKEFVEGIDKDTVYHTIPYWNFENQEGNRVGSEFFQGKVYIADFFFSHCPTICPVMLESLREVQAALKGQDIEIVSYTVDPKNDTPERLKEYVTYNKIDTENWNFVTGNQKDIYELGVNSYFLPNQEDALAPGGFLHSEKIVLVDRQARIRGWYDGRNEEQVKQLINDTKTLLNEK